MSRVAPPFFFTLVSAIITWPLAWHLTSRLGAQFGPGDPFLNLWILGWDLKTISAHPGWLLTGRIFDANIFFPATGTLAYSDHQLIQSLAVWPLYAVTHNLTLCYNAVLLLSLIFSAWAMFAFIRSVTGSAAAAYCAGLVWGFCPFHFSHLIHLQLQSLYWMPLTFWLLHRVVAGRRTRDAAALGVVVALQALSSVYYGVIGAVGLAVAAVVLVAGGRRFERRLVSRFILAAVVAIILAAPGLLPYWRVQQREGFGRTVFEAEHGSAALASYVQAPATNLLYGRTGWLRPMTGGGGPLHRRDGPEQDLFPGLIVLALAAAGLARARKLDVGLVAASLGAVCVAGLVLSLGPLGIRPLYATLHNYVFGFQAVRAPARFSVLALFGLAGLAGIGLDALTRRRSAERTRAWPVALALALITVEYSNGSIAYAPAPSLTTATGRWLRDAPEPGPVLYLPMGRAEEDSSAMIVSLEHGRPIVNGHSGLRPALYAAIVEQLAGFPDSLSLLTLRDLGVRFIVVQSPLPRLLALPGPSPIVERALLADGAIYELRWTPEIEEAFNEMDRVVPPPPGPAPFDKGETARYRVRWVGGPMTVPAGEAVISADIDPAGGFRFIVHATTAAWVRPFFEADDELETRTDAQMLPTIYRESLNEGRRHQRRTVEFDRAGKHVTVTNGDTPAIRLPLQPDARDPIAALFYIRTLPLALGFEARVPVSDAGRSTIVELKVAGAETITLDKQPYDVWKIEPTFATRLTWRDPPRATIWVSRDAHKTPLLIKVSAAFGSVEIERTEYRGR